jgi:hypothetical protein
VSRVSQVHASAVAHLRAALRDLAANGGVSRGASSPAFAARTAHRK